MHFNSKFSFHAVSVFLNTPTCYPIKNFHIYTCWSREWEIFNFTLLFFSYFLRSLLFIFVLALRIPSITLVKETCCLNKLTSKYHWDTNVFTILF